MLVEKRLNNTEVGAQLPIQVTGRIESVQSFYISCADLHLNTVNSTHTKMLQ